MLGDGDNPGGELRVPGDRGSPGGGDVISVLMDDEEEAPNPGGRLGNTEPEGVEAPLLASLGDVVPVPGVCRRTILIVVEAGLDAFWDVLRDFGGGLGTGVGIGGY